MTGLIESGDPCTDRIGFRRSLGEFATGVAVITATVDGISYGLTSNSFASVSLDPPLVLWSIRRESQSFAAFERCDFFAVNILADSQIELSQHFAKSGKDKFQGVPHTLGQGNAPLLYDVAARFECRRSGAYEGGDHEILLGEVRAFARFGRPPLLFSKGRYAVAADHPDFPARAVGVAPLPADGEAEVLSNLMIRAYSIIASELEAARIETGLGLTLMQARLLRACAANPGSRLEALLPELLLDFNSSQNVLASLVAQGLVMLDGHQRVQLTPAGQNCLQQVVSHARQCENALFKDFSTADVATMTSLLSEIVRSKRSVNRANV